MKFSELKNKLWFNIFIRIALIFAVFLVVLYVSNAAFLVRFFSMKEKRILKEQVLNVCELPLSNSNNVLNEISKISEEYHFDVEIYNLNGAVLFTTHGGKMMESFPQKPNSNLKLSHEEMKTVKQEFLKDNVIFETAVRRFDSTEYLLCRKQIDKSTFAEVRIQKQLISNSASIAAEFILIISSLFFIAAIIWVLIFAKKFSAPISDMNEITKDMAKLNFKRRLSVKSRDEIGQLASSVNELSSSLSTALNNLKVTNAKLQNDIELERQLDVMRRGFVANVSHELKTPISIISGYAEGLKLNVNPESTKAYCDTIIEESKRMNKLVLSLLQLSRYESGQIPLNKQVFDISRLCNDSLQKIFDGSDIKTINEIPENTLCLADELQIEQVIKSLLENALAHTPAGGSVITTANKKNNLLKISVLNTGSHIDDEIMPQIWQSFYRGEESHKRDSERFGLGLSIVAAIIKAHGTNCGVNNTDDGVCFWFEVETP